MRSNTLAPQYRPQCVFHSVQMNFYGEILAFSQGADCPDSHPPTIGPRRARRSDPQHHRRVRDDGAEAMAPGSTRAVTRWTSRIIPVILAGCVGLATFVVTDRVCGMLSHLIPVPVAPADSDNVQSSICSETPGKPGPPSLCSSCTRSSLLLSSSRTCAFSSSSTRTPASYHCRRPSRKAGRTPHTTTTTISRHSTTRRVRIRVPTAPG